MTLLMMVALAETGVPARFVDFRRLSPPDGVATVPTNVVFVARADPGDGWVGALAGPDDAPHALTETTLRSLGGDLGLWWPNPAALTPGAPYRWSATMEVDRGLGYDGVDDALAFVVGAGPDLTPPTPPALITTTVPERAEGRVRVRFEVDADTAWMAARFEGGGAVRFCVTQDAMCRVDVLGQDDAMTVRAVAYDLAGNASRVADLALPITRDDAPAGDTGAPSFTPDPTPAGPRPCGCATSGTREGGLLLLAAAALRRRRRT